MKPDFDKAEYTARLLRLSQSNDSLTLDVRNMEFDTPIIFDTFQEYSKITGIPVSAIAPCKGYKDGYIIKAPGYFIVLYNSESSYGIKHINWTLAHEVGHIYLEHTKDDPIEEIEAHWFAAELLSPEPLIKEFAERQSMYNIPVKAYDLQFMFSLSKEAAIKRISSINRKYAWNTTFAKQLIDKYNFTIEKYCSLIRKAHEENIFRVNNLESIRL